MSQSEPKPGTSTGTKVLLGVLIAGGIVTLLCCGAGFWFFGMLRRAVIQDPVKIRELADSIAYVDIPAEFKPQMGLSWGLGVQMKMAAFQRSQSDNLMLMEMVIPGGLSDAQMKQSFQQQRKAQQGGNDPQLRDTSVETRTIQIDGEDRSFDFITGVHPDSDKKVHQVMGVFPGRGGTAFLMLMIDDENWDEDQVMQVLESISTASDTSE